jgi:hypothetical protein
MLNFIGYYYGYLKSLLGYNYINPNGQSMSVEDSEDAEPDGLGLDSPNGEVRVSMRATKPTYLYYSYRNYNSSFAVRGFTTAQTNVMIQGAFAELSKVSGLKVLPWKGGGSPSFSIQFSSKVEHNALAVMDKNKMIISNVRPMTAGVLKTVVQHELLHFLKYKVNPAADKWGHSPDKSCVFNINGNAPKLCPAEEQWLKSKYGQP